MLITILFSISSVFPDNSRKTNFSGLAIEGFRIQFKSLTSADQLYKSITMHYYPCRKKDRVD